MMKNPMRLAVLALLLAPSLATGRTYHVSVDGSDTADGLSAPLRTLARAMALLRAGDTLLVAPGDYGDESRLDLIADGTAAAPIVIRCPVPGGARLRGPRPPGSGGQGSHPPAFHFDGRSHWVVEGFDIRNYWCGLYATGGHHHTVRHCTFAVNGGQGASHRNDDDILYQHCRFFDFHHPDYDNTSHTRDGSDLVLGISDYGVNFYASKRVVVEDSYFYGNHHQGVSFKWNNEHGTVRRCIWEGALHHAVILGQELAPEQHSRGPFLVEDNIFRPAARHRLKEPIAVYNASDVTIRRNYIEAAGDDRDDRSADGPSSGIHVRADAGATGTVRIEGNVFRDGLQDKPAMLLAAPGARYVVVGNTVFRHHRDIIVTAPAAGVDLRDNRCVDCEAPLAAVPGGRRLTAAQAGVRESLAPPPLAADPPVDIPDWQTYHDRLWAPFVAQ